MTMLKISRGGHVAAKKLCSYFERDGQQRALGAYSKFVSKEGWGIGYKMKLYELSKRAFDPAVSHSVALAAFAEIDADLWSHWGLSRKSSGPHWSAQKTFEVIKAEFSGFAWGDPVTLSRFHTDGNHAALLSGLEKMKGLKAMASYPVMAVSKFLHFYNPELFPIYDTKVIYNGVFVWFRNDFKEFCAKSGLQYEYKDTPTFLGKYIRWASSLLASAHSGFMEAFVDWLRKQPGAELQGPTVDPSTLYATAFEFTASGAWCIESAGGH